VRLATVIEVIEGREPTARDVQRVIRRASEENAAVVIASPELSRRAADRVAEATGLRVRMVDPLGGGRGLESYEALMLAITDGLVEGMR
jgi:ABC-type Zn uptake system ZnuABC Zn-binding protein ZnuA